jgi:CRP/FNR family transcriptional regulator, anaerobic regulatory protein
MPIRRELGTITDLEAGARVIPIGSELYRQGDICSTYFIVLNGWIALSVLLDDGSCQILDFALPGAILGFQSAPNAPMYHSARCLSVVRVHAFPRRKLDVIIETNPRLAVLLCRQVTADEARAHDHLANIGLRDARQRIAHLLLELYVRVHGRLPVESGETIQLPLSQGQIGQALGLTYVHVCRTLQILREQKIVHLANHTLEIIDPVALMTAAGVEPDVLSHQRHDGLRSAAKLVSYPSNWEATGSLPAGWMPVQNDRAVSPGFTSASSGHAFIAAQAA